MKYKRILAMLLCALILTSACGKKTQEETEKKTVSEEPFAETETVDPAKVLSLTDTDWGGRNYRVLGYRCDEYPQFSTFEVVSEGETGEVVNDAIYRRNTSVEDKYNVHITEYTDYAADFWVSGKTEMYNAIMAGEDLYDLAFMVLGQVGDCSRQQLMHDLNTIENIDFSKAWWNQEVNNTMTLMNKLFFTSSDFSLRDKNRIYFICYNKDMVTDLGVTNPTEATKNGIWTLDLMTEEAVAASQDLNGNGEVDLSDSFGLGSGSTESIFPFVYACNVDSLGKDADGIPMLTLNTEHTIDVLDKVLKLYGQKNITLECEDWKGKTGNVDHNAVAGMAFYEGRELFYTSCLHSLERFSEKCDFNYGILPFPKYDEEQENYRSYADKFGMLFGIPISCNDTAFAGFVLEALSAASTDTSLKAYYEVSSKTKYAYDEDSAAILDLIFANIYYDMSMVYNINGSFQILKDIAYKKTNEFASRYAKMEPKALTDIEKLIVDYTAE